MPPSYSSTPRAKALQPGIGSAGPLSWQPSSRMCGAIQVRQRFSFQRIIIYFKAGLQERSFSISLSQYQSANPIKVSSRSTGMRFMIAWNSRSHRAISSVVELPDVMPVSESESPASVPSASCWLQVCAPSISTQRRSNPEPASMRSPAVPCRCAAADIPRPRSQFPGSFGSSRLAQSGPHAKVSTAGEEYQHVENRRGEAGSGRSSLSAPNYNLKSIRRQPRLRILIKRQLNQESSVPAIVRCF